MGRGAVDLGFPAVPLAVRSIGGEGLAPVGQHFFVVNTAELVPGIRMVLFVFLAEGRTERAAADIPEFRDLHALRVDFQGGAHRREEYGRRAGGTQNQVRFLLEGVDGVKDVVVALQPERSGGVRVIGLLQGCDLRVRVDVQQAVTQRFDLDLSDGAGRGHQLPEKRLQFFLIRCL